MLEVLMIIIVCGITVLLAVNAIIKLDIIYNEFSNIYEELETCIRYDVDKDIMWAKKSKSRVIEESDMENRRKYYNLNLADIRGKK